MTQEDKELLLKDLCSRLPYGVKGHLSGLDIRIEISGINGNDVFCKPLRREQKLTRDIRYIKPYLRPMSSITKEEYNELKELIRAKNSELDLNEITAEVTIDWLNKKMFDFRGLIPKDLALSTEEFDPYTEEFFNHYED